MTTYTNDLSPEAVELATFAVNEYDLHQQYAKLAVDAVANAAARGKYGDRQARDAFMPMVMAAARRYVRQFADAENARVFTKQDKLSAAEQVRGHYAQQIAERTADLIGPEHVVVVITNFGRDANGNPTGLHYVDGVAPYTRRQQVGYRDERQDGVAKCMDKAGIRSEWYTRGAVDGSREAGEITSVYYRKPVSIPGAATI